MTKLSIIIPIYNAENYIENTLASIFSEDLDYVEVILIDDGSTDNSISIVKKNYSRYIEESKIRIFCQENKGVSEARNCGLDRANGEYVTFVDADDIVLRGYTAEILNCIETYGTDIIEFGCRQFSDDKDIEKNPDIYTYSQFGHFDIKDVINDIFSTSIFYPPLRVIKRSCIGGTTFPANIKYCEDLIFFNEIYKKVDTTFHINNILYGYRINPDGATKNIRPEYITDLMNFYTQLGQTDEKHINLLKANLLYILYKLHELTNNRFKAPPHIKRDQINVFMSTLLYNGLSIKKKVIIMAPGVFYSLRKIIKG